MAKALNQQGEIGIIFHAADFFVTAQRYEGFKKTIEENYPNINIYECNRSYSYAYNELQLLKTELNSFLEKSFQCHIL